jgi:hypothetical protein
MPCCSAAEDPVFFRQSLLAQQDINQLQEIDSIIVRTGVADTEDMV